MSLFPFILLFYVAMRLEVDNFEIDWQMRRYYTISLFVHILFTFFRELLKHIFRHSVAHVDEKKLKPVFCRWKGSSVTEPGKVTYFKHSKRSKSTYFKFDTFSIDLLRHSKFNTTQIDLLLVFHTFWIQSP